MLSFQACAQFYSLILQRWFKIFFVCLRIFGAFLKGTVEISKFRFASPLDVFTAVISHTRPPTIFSQFQKLRFGGRQSNVSMTITASGVTGTTISMSIFRVSELLFQLYLTRR